LISFQRSWIVGGPKPDGGIIHKSYIDGRLVSRSALALNRRGLGIKRSEMPDGFTIYAYTLGAGSSLSYVSDEAQAFEEARRHRLFLLEDPTRQLPDYTIVYKVLLRPVQSEALLDMLNDRGCAVERLVETMEPIGKVA
jgi:hypothetical protein